MNEIEGAEQETPEERLVKIKAVIPEAEAMITHPRNKLKVTAVLRTETARDRVLRNGLKDIADFTLIRQPNMVMINSIPIDIKVTNMKSDVNEEWLKQARGVNNKGLERV